MAKLKAKKRNSLRRSQFAIPSKRMYPIHDKAHARNALSRAAQKNTRGSYATVRKAVLKKYPSLKKTAKKKK